MKLEFAHVSTDALVPDTQNARQHPTAQIEKLERSIRASGFIAPVIVGDDNRIIAGHARVRAAARCGIASVPVIRVAGLSSAQQTAYALADNRVALDGNWKWKTLDDVFASLRADGIDLATTGFDPGEFEIVTGLADPSSDEETLLNAHGVKSGDRWRCGPHIVVCGDSTDPAVAAACLHESEPVMMVTDPPYGVNIDAVNERRGTLRADNVFGDDSRADWADAYRHFRGAVAYVWCARATLRTFQDTLHATGLTSRDVIVWSKNMPTVTRGDYHPAYELCVYAVRDGATSGWTGSKRETNLWEYDVPVGAERSGHPTQKPIECMARPLRNNSRERDHIYDPFLGSGTTLIACEQMGRILHAIELNPVFVDIALTRWEKLTNAQAERLA